MPSEKEVQEMQEKLQDMNPEEMKEFQKENCIFCQIISGKVASKKIYEDDQCIAILDINPANPGHVLLMPKEHYAIMPLIPEETIKHLFMISKQISSSLLKSLKLQGTNIFVANGAAAGQKAQHFMLHVIPRMEDDDLKLDIRAKKVDEKTLEPIRKKLVVKINQDFGIVQEEEPKEEEKVIEKEKTKPKEKPIKKETKTKKPIKKETKTQPKKTEKAKPKEEKVSLDDIATLITGGD
jgi:histidine triad (HIT) family protein